MENPTRSSLPKYRNFYVSYIKGSAMLGIILIHLIDWTNIQLPLWGRVLKEGLYSSLFLFMLTTGSLIYIAYVHRPSLFKSSLRLMYRGIQLLFIYYLYNIIKVLVFNFSTQPFYLQFINIGTLDPLHILSFQSFSVPITILPTYSFLLFLSPLLLLIHKKFRRSKILIASLMVAFFSLNYLSALPQIHTALLDFLYANGYAIIPLALWALPFIFGFFLAQTGFEKNRRVLLIVSGLATGLFVLWLVLRNGSLFPSDYQFPLMPYLMAFGTLMLSLLLFVFRYLETLSAVWVKKMLAAIRLIGDNTLHLYILHWVVIDCTIWVLSPYIGFIWLATAIFLVSFIAIKRKKFSEYYHRQNNAALDMASEIT